MRGPAVRLCALVICRFQDGGAFWLFVCLPEGFCDFSVRSVFFLDMILSSLPCLQNRAVTICSQFFIKL